MNFDETSSEELALMTQRGDAAAFNALILRYQDRLFNYLSRRLHSRQDAEDITQEAFIRAYDKIHLYDPQWRFSTWLYTIATRLAASHARRMKKTVSLNNVEFGAGYYDSTSADMSDQEEVTRIWELAENILSDKQMTALTLRYAEERSIKEIAKIMGKTAVYVRVLLYRGREALINELKARDPEFAADPEMGRGKSTLLNNRLGGINVGKKAMAW